MRKRKFMFALTATAIMSLGCILSSCGNQEETVTPEADKFTVKLTFDKTLGTVVVDKESGEITSDAKVTVTITPKEEATVKEIKVNGAAKDATKLTFDFVPTKGENTINVTFEKKAPAVVPTIEADKEIVELASIGAEDTINLTIKDIADEVVWSATDEETILLTPSEDGKSCVVKNILGGKTVIVTATAGDYSVDVVVKTSLFGDTRKEYSVYKADGTKIADVTGFYVAVDKLNEDHTNVGGYITLKGAEEKLYQFAPVYLNAINSDKTSSEFDSNDYFENGKAHWFPDFEKIIDLSQTSTVFSTELVEDGNKSGNYNTINSRPIAYGSALFKDGVDGFNEATNPGIQSIWCGFRNTSYLQGMSGPRYSTWADAYRWKDVSMTWDLSSSKIVPSYNETKSAFAQIYLGSAVVTRSIVGMYFDAGTIKETEKLEDGATRDIYTFQEKFITENGLADGNFGEREIGTTSIGKAKWDKFNKCWTFPKVKVGITCDIKFSDDPGNEGKNYTRDYVVTGYQDNEAVASKEYKFDSGIINRQPSSERTIYGASLTPVFEKNHLPDLNCGAKWLHLIQDTSVANKLEGEPDNLQWVQGRTINQAAQLYLQGAENTTSSSDADGRSIFNIVY